MTWRNKGSEGGHFQDIEPVLKGAKVGKAFKSGFDRV